VATKQFVSTEGAAPAEEATAEFQDVPSTVKLLHHTPPSPNQKSQAFALQAFEALFFHTSPGQGPPPTPQNAKQA